MKRTIRETRETIFELGKVRIMMLEVRDGVVMTWPKGTRRKQPVSLVAAWQRGVKRDVEELKRKGKRR